MQFADITATGKVIIYMDDILIVTEDDLSIHQKLVNQVLQRLDKLDLYLKPSKCQFEVRKIEFLRVVLEGGTVTMDPIKVAVTDTLFSCLFLKSLSLDMIRWHVIVGQFT